MSSLFLGREYWGWIFSGVYALLAAHLANVLLNYNNMEFGLVRLLGVFLIGNFDYITFESLPSSLRSRYLHTILQIFELKFYLDKYLFPYCSKCWRWICHLRSLRCPATANWRFHSTSLIRGSPNRGTCRPHYWSPRSKKLWAETSGAVDVVARPRDLRCMHALRNSIQHFPSDVSLRLKATEGGHAEE